MPQRNTCFKRIDLLCIPFQRNIALSSGPAVDALKMDTRDTRSLFLNTVERLTFGELVKIPGQRL